MSKADVANAAIVPSKRWTNRVKHYGCGFSHHHHLGSLDDNITSALLNQLSCCELAETQRLGELHIVAAYARVSIRQNHNNLGTCFSQPFMHIWSLLATLSTVQTAVWRFDFTCVRDRYVTMTFRVRRSDCATLMTVVVAVL